jgi:putative SOS response-associated peptidase YedK
MTHPDPKTDGFTDQLQYRAESKGPDDPIQSQDPAALTRCAPMGTNLIPYWANDPKIAHKTINARGETVDTAPSYRQAFEKRRCLIPADGFYEWKKVVGGKIPYSIGMKDDAPFVFAGLWEGWKDPATQEWLHTCTIITGKPNELVAQIHTRMPVILGEEHHEAWLTNQAGKEVLVPSPRTQ